MEYCPKETDLKTVISFTDHSIPPHTHAIKRCDLYVNMSAVNKCESTFILLMSV